MAWNGAGGFTRDNGTNTGSTVWQDDRDAGTKIRADNHDTHDQDLADGIQACIAKNGENAFTGNANFGGNRGTNAAAGSAASDFPTMSQAQAGNLDYAADTGAANAYLVSLTPAATAYTTGMKVCFKPANTNTGASTINVNALGVKNIFLDGAALTGGEIMAGDMVELRYDGTQFAVTSFPRRKRVSGPVSSADGPHLGFYVDGDSNPLGQLLFWGHDSCHLAFDAHWDGANWISDDAGSNCRLAKNNDRFSVNMAGGYAAGSSITWTEALRVDTNGNVVMPNDSNGTTTNILSLGAGPDLRLYHDGADSKITNSTGDLYLVSNATSETMFLQAKDSALNVRTMVSINADSGTSFGYAGATKVRIDASGLDLVSGVALGPSGSVGAPTWSFSSDPDTGAYRSGTNTYAIAAGGSVAAVFGSTNTKVSSGNLTVGPASELNINTTGAHPTISAAKASGDLYIKNNATSGRIYVTGADAGSIETILFYANPDGVAQMYYNGTWKVRADATGAVMNGSCEPLTDNLHDVGSLTHRWDDVYATNGTIQTSDLREKFDIRPCNMGLEFVDMLKPLVFKRTGGTRDHYGFGAQDVEVVLTNMGLQTADFAGFIKSDVVGRDGVPTGETRYGLRYEEFIAPTIKAVQELSAENKALKAQVSSLEARLAGIEAKLAGV